MISERHGDTVLVWAPAKVNLFLDVLGKRSDGYHEIATLMVAVSLCDTLEFQEEASGDVVVSCDHPDLATGPENLVCRAAELVRRHTGCRTGACIRLRKRIPIAAGLAGGSTDAAATLEGLNQLWSLNLSRQELLVLAAELGSDVPFFLTTPAAWCTGRGEVTEAVMLNRVLWLVLICPPVGVATADVYRDVVVPVSPQNGAAILRAVQSGTVEEIGAGLHNRLEEPAIRLCPEIAAVRAKLARQQPAGVLMSGSGATVFALCRNRDEAVRIACAFRRDGDEGSRPRVHLVRSCV
jgi:4-diphosphocytidyl-2-C-methyl-D-erythritol kinase